MPRTNLNSAYQQTNKTTTGKLCRSKINSVQQRKIIINNQLIANSHKNPYYKQPQARPRPF